MAPADRLAARRLGRGCSFARSDGEEDAAEVNVKGDASERGDIELTTGPLAVASTGFGLSG